MQKKKQLIGPEGIDTLLIGVNKMANAVGSTLGPKGRNVLIQNEFGNVRSTKDGFTVAKELELMNNLENVGARTFPALFISDDTCKINILERNFFFKFYSCHDHSGHPEENNIRPGNQI